MDIGFIFLSALFYYTIINQHTYSEATDPEHFHIIKDQELVDKLARKYAKHSYWRTALKNKISKEKKIGGICDHSPQIKVEFCRRFLPMVYFGYDFKGSTDEALMCQENTFWTRKRNKSWIRDQKIFRGKHDEQWKEKSNQLEMYSCPDIFYTDLQSDTDITVEDKYFVSRGPKEDSAILFFHGLTSTSDAKIYPQKYIKNISFHDLIPRQRASADQLPQIQKLGINLDPISVEEELIAYRQAINLRKPYDKFQRTFFSINICGQRKSPKVHLCRECIREFYGSKVELRFDQDYDDYQCRKGIKIRVDIWNNDNFSPSTTRNTREQMQKSQSFFKVDEVSLFFLHCPRMLVSNKNDFVYLASNLHRHSVFFYMRTNDSAESFDLKAIISELSFDRIVKHNRRIRVQPYPTPDERHEKMLELKRNHVQELANEINSIYSSVQTPTTIAKADEDRLDKLAYSPRSVQVIQKHRLVEDIVIEYSEIKTMKLPYERFRMTRWSLDICELPRIVKVELCKNIASKYPLDLPNVDPDGVTTHSGSLTFNLGEHSDNEIYYTPKEGDMGEDDRCTENQIRLGIREIGKLKTESFHMWMCPKERGGLDHMNIVYIAKCHFKNTALIFRTDSNPESGENNVYPDAVVTKIDRDDLAMIVLAD